MKECARATSWSFAFASVLVVLSAVPSSVFAQAAAEPTELPQSGSLSRTFNQAAASRQIDDPWGGTDLNQDTQAPISGSVNPKGRDRWIIKVFNNSQDSYTVNVRLQPYDKSQKKLRSSYYTFVFRPGQSTEREAPRTDGAMDAGLDLVSWTKQGGEKPKSEEKVVDPDTAPTIALPDAGVPKSVPLPLPAE